MAAGEVVTLGLRGTLSCYDAGSGKLLWRKNEYPGALPRFETCSSQILADGLCVAQLGRLGKGALSRPWAQGVCVHRGPGSVLLALTPASELVVLKPGAGACEEVARIKMAESPT